MTPSSNPSESTFAHLKRDFLASIVVFLVALPLCLGIANAVGVSPALGLITGIVGGIVVGYFAGCPLQVSGPAAGLFVIMAKLVSDSQTAYLSKHASGLQGEALAAAQSEAMTHAVFVLGAACFLAGVLQYLAGMLRIGQWFRAVSPSVIEGMLAGIGVLILVSQLHVMLDHKPLMADGHKAHEGWQYIMLLPDAFYKTVVPHAADVVDENPVVHHWAAGLGILTIAVIVLWQSFAPKKLKLIPGPLLAVVLASFLTASLNLAVMPLEVPSNIFTDSTLLSLFTNRPMVGDGLASGLGIYFLRMIASAFTWSTLMAAFVIAIVASAETLLCATAVDQMQDGPRTNYDKELSAQGVGNMICGLFGSLPMTGVIVRSSANIMAGARTRLSSILHGAWLLLFVIFAADLLELIPKAALGAILVYTGYKLLNLKTLKRLWSVGKSEAAIFLVTMITIVATDLLIGVMTGVALSALKLLVRFSQLSTNLTVEPDGRKAVLRLGGAATFIRLPVLAGELEKIPGGAELHVDFQNLTYIDHACLELLMNWAKQHKMTGGKLVIDWDSLHARFKPHQLVNVNNAILTRAESKPPTTPSPASISDTAAVLASENETLVETQPASRQTGGRKASEEFARRS